MPPEFLSTISSFSSHFTKPSWRNGIILLTGAILCPGSRTVCNCLRVLGLTGGGYHKYHRWLSRGRWSALRLSGSLFKLLVSFFFAETHSIVIAMDETIERRWGSKISKRGIYRDAVRSSRKHKVMVNGLRWLVLAVIVPLPWLNGKSWALPFLSIICPSKGYFERSDAKGKPKILTDYVLRTMDCLQRWTKLLNHSIYLVGDGTYAVFDLLKAGRDKGLHWIVRGRMDTILCHFPKPKKPGTRGVQAKVGKELLKMSKRINDGRVKWKRVVFSDWYGQKDKTMLYCTGKSIWYKGRHYRLPVQWVLLKDPEGKEEPVFIMTTCFAITPKEMIINFVGRWQIEVTFAEVRRHLGVETQRQWSPLAIERTTPMLMGLFSICCLFASRLYELSQLKPQTTGWYKKQHLTFSDVLFAVRDRIWEYRQYSILPSTPDLEHYRQIIRYLWQTLSRTAA